MDTSLISSIILLVAVLAAIGAIAYGVYRARKAAREFSQLAFGTNSLKEGFEKAEYQAEHTPKSLSAQTGLALERIMADFPEFNYDDMRARAKNVIVSYLRCIDENDAHKLSEGNAELKRDLTMRLEMLRNVQNKEQYDNVEVHRIEISRYTKRNGRCIITFQCSLQSNHSLEDAEGKVVEGNPEKWEQSRWETDLVYIQDPSKLTSPELAALGISCPNCGAPITSLGEKTCAYCGTTVREINLNAWTFNAVREA